MKDAPVPMLTQSGDELYNNVDQMILHRVAALPHASIKTTSDLENLNSYIDWIKSRISLLAEHEYRPILHFDAYGTFGMAYRIQPSKIIAERIPELEKTCIPISFCGLKTR